MDVQRHRGPDDQGIVVFRYDGTVREAEIADKLYGEGNFDGGFGFNRLSIKDLSMEGHQPMLSDNKKVILVFNGEIYNDAELRKELINKGYNFRSTTDTEVILKMYEEYGFEQMIGRLNGMFAIVIMDLRTNFLYMARDRFGIKPLYYSDVDGKLYFASELKSIIQFKEFKRELDFDAFNARIIFPRPSDKVLLQNVNMLDPGWAFIVSPNGNVRRWQFWNIDHYERQRKYKNIDDAIEALDGILSNAVARQLVSDVKVGCQVSGGIDSTLVSYYANKAGVFQPFLSRLNLGSGSLKSYGSYAEYEVMSDSTITGFTAKDYDNTAELIAEEIDRFNKFKGSNFTKHLKYETMYRLPESCLRQDKMTMASSIENRVPLLDNEVVDFIMELPESMLLHFKEGSPLEMGDNPFEWIDGKYIYKELLARKFGHDFVYRKKGIMVFDEKTLLACAGFKTLFYDKIFPSMKKEISLIMSISKSSIAI